MSPLPFSSSFDTGNTTPAGTPPPRRAMDGGSRNNTPRTGHSRRWRETTVNKQAEAGPFSIIPPQSDTPSRSYDQDLHSSFIKHSRHDSTFRSHDPSPNRSCDRSQSRHRQPLSSPPASGSELSDDQRLMARDLFRMPGVRNAMRQATRGVAKQKMRRAVARGKAKLKRAFMRAGDDKSSGAGSRGRRKAKRRSSKTNSMGSSLRSTDNRAAKWVNHQSQRSAVDHASPRSPYGSEGYSFDLSSPTGLTNTREHTGLTSFGSPTIDFSRPEAQSTPARRGSRIRPPSMTDSLAEEESEELWRQSEQSIGMRDLQDTSAVPAECAGE